MTRSLKLIHVLKNLLGWLLNYFLSGIHEALSPMMTTHNRWHHTEQITTNTPFPPSIVLVATSRCVDGSAQQTLEGLERSRKKWKQPHPEKSCTSVCSDSVCRRTVTVKNISFPQSQPETARKYSTEMVPSQQGENLSRWSQIGVLLLLNTSEY